MKIKVSKTTNTQLDWLVANCLGHQVVIESVEVQADRFNACVLVDGSKPPQAAIDAVIAALKPRMKIEGSHGIHLVPVPSYSTDWSQGGPIIEREKIVLRPHYVTGIACVAYLAVPDLLAHFPHSGPTPLIAAMCCFVASCLGDEVEVPDELCK